MMNNIHQKNLEIGVMVSRFARYEKSSWNFGGALVLFETVSFYIGRTDHWGIGANINFYDRSFTIEILNLYFGVEVWNRKRED
jgi:hypothetical protein